MFARKQEESRTTHCVQPSRLLLWGLLLLVSIGLFSWPRPLSATSVESSAARSSSSNTAAADTEHSSPRSPFSPAHTEDELLGPRIPQDYSGLWSVFISVELANDGSAEITEYWQARFPENSDKTELYIPKRFKELGFVSESLQVRAAPAYDAQGQPYVFGQLPWRDFRSLGERWDPDASFQEKRYACGIHRADAQTDELCFGISERGQALVYAVQYQIRHAVWRFTDGAKGNNIRFVNDQLSPSPRHAGVHLYLADGRDLIAGENARIWGFGFKGRVGTIEDHSKLFSSAPHHLLALAEPMTFSRKAHMTLVFALDDPQIQAAPDPLKRSFENVKKTAFRNSSYEKKKRGPLSKLLTRIISLCIAGAFCAYMYKLFLEVSGQRIIPLRRPRKIRKPEACSAEPPYDGDFLLCYYFATQRSLTKKVAENGQAYFSALLLDWIRQGAIQTVTPVKANGKKDYSKTQLLLLKRPQHFAYDFASDYWDLLCEIVLQKGENAALCSKDLKTFFRKNANQKKAFKILIQLKKSLPTILTLGQYGTVCGLLVKKLQLSPKGLSAASQFLAFQDYLLNYSLHNTREAYEAAVWDQLLVSAAACGCAKQAFQQMRNLVPEYQFAADVNSSDGLFETYYFFNFLEHLTAETMRGNQSSGSSFFGSGGGGGFSSFGGGGGFSGGSSGGGAR